jgi:hypothetical protein
MELLQKLWTTFYPQGPGLDSDGRAVLNSLLQSVPNFCLNCRFVF